MLTQQISTAVGGSTARHIKVALGVVVPSVTALIAVRFSMCRDAQLPVAGGGPPAAALHPAASTAVSRVSLLLASFRDVLKRGGL